MTILRIIVLSIITSAIASVAQDARRSSAPPISRSSAQLQFKSTAKVPFNGTVVIKFRCDASGNIYAVLLPRDTSRQSRMAPPITKLRPDGTIAGTFAMTDLDANFGAFDFFVTDNGSIFRAAVSERDNYVISPSGKAVRLNAERFIPYQIVVFPTGNFLLSGIHGKANMTPYTAVFGSSGELIKSIYEPEDAAVKERAETAGTNIAFVGQPQQGNSFVTSGDAILGSDGNAYLLRAGDPALIYVISNKGAVVGKLRIAAPSAGLVATALKSSSGKLAVVFNERSKSRGFVVITDYTGRVLSTVDGSDPRMFAGNMACYEDDDLTFVGFDDAGDIQINRAELK